MDDNLRAVCRILAWLVAAAFLATVLYSPICGAQTPAGQRSSKPPGQTAQGPPTMKAAPAPVVPPQKKELVFDPAIFAALEKELLKTDLKPASLELSNALKETGNWEPAVANNVGYYQSRAKVCPQLKFSADDQKKAGCTGNDTVNQCSEKLFWECMRTNNGGFPEKKVQMLESVARLEKALKEYSAKLKMIPTK